MSPRFAAGKGTGRGRRYHLERVSGSRTVLALRGFCGQTGLHLSPKALWTMSGYGGYGQQGQGPGQGQLPQRPPQQDGQQGPPGPQQQQFQPNNDNNGPSMPPGDPGDGAGGENGPPNVVQAVLFGNVPFAPHDRSRIKRSLGMQLGPEFVATRQGPGGCGFRAFFDLQWKTELPTF